MAEFHRRAHHYLSDLPEDKNRLEWLALMQHHGCPTRLLDFTRSFWVGLFFAVENARSDCALWAIKREYIEKNLAVSPSEEYLHSTYIEEAESEADKVLSSPKEERPQPGILLVEPGRMNERLSIQQGLFSFPKDIGVSFEENLCTSWRCKSLSELGAKDGGLAVVKIVIPEGLCSLLIWLLSTMNINAATLFPGLDGFGRSQMKNIKSAELNQDIRDRFWREILSSTTFEEAANLAFKAKMESEGRNPKKQQ